MPSTHSTAKHNKILDFLRIAVISDGIIQGLTGRLVPRPRSASRRAYSALLTNGLSSGGGWTEEEAGNSQHHRVRGERVTDFNPITLRRDAGGGGMGVGPFIACTPSRDVLREHRLGNCRCLENLWYISKQFTFFKPRGICKLNLSFAHFILKECVIFVWRRLLVFG